MTLKESAERIVEYVGGTDNIVNYTHCATRLRFQVKDKKKVQSDKLQELEKVMGVVDKAGQIQVIIGPDVNQVYNQVLDICPIGAGGEVEAEEETVEEDLTFMGRVKKGFDTVLGYVSGSIAPTLPVIIAYGMVQAILLLLTNLHVLSNEADVYKIYNTVASAAMYFLPALIAFSAAQKLKTNAYLAAFLSLAFISNGISGAEELSFLGIKAMTINYASNIIPVLFMVPVLMLVERLVDKYLPKAVMFVLKPLIITLIMVPAILLVLGPIGTVIGTALAKLCIALSGYGAISMAILSFINPVLVLTGTHTVLIPLIINEIATYGYSVLFTKAFSNFVNVGVGLAVALKAKKKENKELAVSTTITQFFGVGEPIIYGVLIRLKRPFISSLIACGITGFFVGLMNIKAYGVGSLGLFTMPIFIGGGDMKNFYLACLCALIAIAVGFVVTFLMGFEED